MSVKAKLIGNGVRMTGSVLAHAGARDFESGTTKGLLRFVSGSVLRRLPELIDPDNLSPSPLADALSAGTTIAAAKSAKNGGILAGESVNYVALRQGGSVLLETATGNNPDRADTVGKLANDATIALDVVSRTLYERGSSGFGEMTDGISKILHLGSTAVLARYVMFDDHQSASQFGSVA